VTRVIGLISGTSADGIDAALVEIAGGTADLRVECLRATTYPYPPELRSRILAVCGGEPLSVAELAALDDAIAREFARAALAIQDPTRPAEAIGSHGQTVYHRPPDSGAEMPLGCSVQLGRGEAIAYRTGLPTVSDFRAADLAAGGEGAPLVPAVDAHLLRHPAEYRCIQNLGGIGNVTALPPGKLGESEPVRGWDTGPGNALLDLAVESLSGGQQTYDRDGARAAAGTPDAELVERWLRHPFFRTPPPKSTGRELFGPDYLRECLQDAESRHLTPADFLATLTELTAASVADSYRHFLPRQPDRVLLCGGGSHNHYLRSRLERHLDPVPIQTTTEMGVDADFKEAIAFAVLAYWRLLGIPGNLPAVTGATRAVLLGNISPPLRPA